MVYNFKKFEGRSTKEENRISITKSNSFGFPRKFYIENNISEFKFVTLYWDEQNKAIGLKFGKEDEGEDKKSRFSIIHYSDKGGSVVCKSFFTSNNIDTAIHHGRYTWETQDISEIGKLYIIKLKNNPDVTTDGIEREQITEI